VTCNGGRAEEDTMRLTVADAISPSYFVAVAAVQLGFFQQEGVDMEFVFAPPNPSQALKDGAIDFFGGSPYTGLRTFPGGRGGVLLCALSHYNYWFLGHLERERHERRVDLDTVLGGVQPRPPASTFLGAGGATEGATTRFPARRFRGGG